MEDNFPTEIIAPRPEISLAEKDNPFSILNALPLVVSRYVEEHLHTHGELFDLDERDLLKKLRVEHGTLPSPLDHRLRLKFWMEWDSITTYGHKTMNIARVLAGMCSKELFYNKYIKNPQKMAWLLCPPTGYMVKSEEALEFGLDQLRDILEQDHVIGGKLDTKIGELKAKIVAMLDNRVKGAVVQKTMSLNVHASASKIKGNLENSGTSMDNILAQIRVLEEQNERAKNMPSDQKKDIDVS